jgi:elongation factor G
VSTDGDSIDFDLDISGVTCTVLQAEPGEGRYISHRDGVSRYGHVKVVVSPHPGIHCYRFVWEPLKTSLPLPFMRAACLEGVKRALVELLADGRQIAFVEVSIVDGSYHEHDTNEQAVVIAAFMAVRDALARATLVDG